MPLNAIERGIFARFSSAQISQRTGAPAPSVRRWKSTGKIPATKREAFMSLLNVETTSEKQALRMSEVELVLLTGRKRSTVRRWLKKGKVPKQALTLLALDEMQKPPKKERPLSMKPKIIEWETHLNTGYEERIKLRGPMTPKKQARIAAWILSRRGPKEHSFQFVLQVKTRMNVDDTLPKGGYGKIALLDIRDGEVELDEDGTYEQTIEFPSLSRRDLEKTRTEMLALLNQIPDDSKLDSISFFVRKGVRK